MQPLNRFTTNVLVHVMDSPPVQMDASITIMTIWIIAHVGLNALVRKISLVLNRLTER